jgi:hypothetical protein
MVVAEQKRTPEGSPILPQRMAEILGLSDGGLPVRAFRKITEATQGHYDLWTGEILGNSGAIEALGGAETIVELGPGAHAAMTRIVAEKLAEAGQPLWSAVLIDVNPTIAAIAVANAKRAGIDDVIFRSVDLRSSQGLEEISKLGGEGNILAARALLNQMGRGADVMINQVFPNFGKGVVLDLAHPQENPQAWKFSPAHPNDSDAEQAVKWAEELTETLYQLLKLDGRQLLGSQLGDRLGEAGLGVVHHQVVPEDPWQELITEQSFADVPRIIAAIVAYNLMTRGENLPLDLGDFGQQLQDYDRFLGLLNDGRVKVSAIQFGGAVWNGKG